MKLFRRISALALAVIMICLLSMSVFAASPTYHVERNSENVDRGYVEADASISRYSTTGSVTMVTPDIPGNEITIYAHEYHYIMNVGTVMSLSGPINFSDSATYTDCLSVTKSYPNYIINTMGWAVYDFYATFMLNQTQQVFDESCEVSFVDR